MRRFLFFIITSWINFFRLVINFEIMKINIVFDFAKVYYHDFPEDIYIDVVKGQPFGIHTDSTTDIDFSANNDPVLDLLNDGKNIKAVAAQIGKSRIIIMDNNLAHLKIVYVNVVETVDMISTLGVTIGTDVDKDS